jgi:glycerophosphoryl diester phosphodiesterase
MKPRPLAALSLTLLAALALPAASQVAVPDRSDRPATIDGFLRLGQRPRVIAHRGFSGRAPENTSAAVRRAIEVKADMVEIDVLLSRDREVVVIHDDTLERTTDGKGPVAAHTLEEIRRLDAGSWFGEEFTGEKVPTLGEVLDLVRGRILLNVEIKGEAVTPEVEGGVVDEVLRLVGERGMGEQVILSSFDPAALAQARQLDPKIRTASLYNRKLHRGMGPLEVMTAVGSQGFNLSARRLSRQIVRACHRHGRPVAVYTVDDPAKMRRLIDKGVDAIFTNRPDLMLRVLAETVPRAAERDCGAAVPAARAGEAPAPQR